MLKYNQKARKTLDRWLDSHILRFWGFGREIFIIKEWLQTIPPHIVGAEKHLTETDAWFIIEEYMRDPLAEFELTTNRAYETNNYWSNKQG